LQQPALRRVDGKLVEVPGRNPHTPAVRLEPDIVGEEGRVHHPLEPQAARVGDVDDCYVLGRGAEPDPEPLPLRIGGYVARPLLELQPPAPVPGCHVDRHDLLRA